MYFLFQKENTRINFIVLSQKKSIFLIKYYGLCDLALMDPRCSGNYGHIPSLAHRRQFAVISPFHLVVVVISKKKKKEGCCSCRFAAAAVALLLVPTISMFRSMAAWPNLLSRRVKEKTLLKYLDCYNIL